MVTKFNKFILLSLIIFSQAKLHSMFINLNKFRIFSRTNLNLQTKTNLSRKFTQYSDFKIGIFKEEFIKDENGKIIKSYPMFIKEIDLKEFSNNEVIKIIKYLKDLETKQDTINSEHTKDLAEIKLLLKEFIKNRSLENKKLLKIKSLLKRDYYVSSPEDAVEQYNDTLYEIEEALDEE